MKKLLIVALFAASLVGIAEAGRCRRNNNCGPCRTECAPCPVKCLPPTCIVDCETSFCEGAKPDLCALKPARVNLVKHTDTNVFYTCADLGPCEVKASQAQIDALKANGAIAEETMACP